MARLQYVSRPGEILSAWGRSLPERDRSYFKALALLAVLWFLGWLLER